MRTLQEQIQAKVDELDPHAIVTGLGESCKALLDLKLRPHVRVYGVNDVFKITPVHDLVVIDPPLGALDRLWDRYTHIARSSPERLWLYYPNWHLWKWHLKPRFHDKMRRIDLRLMDMDQITPESSPPMLAKHPFDHMAISPACATLLAWQQGARRIGILGVDLIPGNHHMAENRHKLSWYFSHLAFQAQQLHGAITNLCPWSHLKISPKTVENHPRYAPRFAEVSTS